jgi:hypothetical protein
MAVALLATAAAVALVVSRVRPVDVGIRVKGQQQIWIYWERGGDVKPLEPGTALASGDRVRAEVLAPEAVVAYWAVTNAAGRLLSPAADVWASALRLGPGERGAFAGSLKLVGASEGETLVVITCRGRDLARAAVDDWGRDGGPVLSPATLPSACALDSFRLR